MDRAVAELIVEAALMVLSVRLSDIQPGGPYKHVPKTPEQKKLERDAMKECRKLGAECSTKHWRGEWVGVDACALDRKTIDKVIKMFKDRFPVVLEVSEERANEAMKENGISIYFKMKPVESKWCTSLRDR